MAISVLDWLRLARHPGVVRRAAKTASIVGPILIAINQGDAIIRGDVTLVRVAKMVLTVMVPYSVSTFSSVGAMIEAGVARAALAGREGPDIPPPPSPPI